MFSEMNEFVAAVDPASISSMSPREQVAFRDVSAACEHDVQQMCGSGDNNMLGGVDSFFLMPPGLASLREMESFIDHVMVSSLHMPASSSSEESTSFLLILEDPQPQVMIDCVDRAVQHMLSEIAGKTPVEKVSDTAQRIANHGSILLETQPEDETHARVARRLSEVTPEDLQERQQALMPFSSTQTECLRAAYTEARLSLACGRAIYRLDQIRDKQYRAEWQFRQDRAVVMVNLLCLYALVIATGMVIYWRRRKDIRAKRRLTRQIFQAIYSKPDLKHAVEREMGRSAGNVPPLHGSELWRMGLLGRELKGVFKTCRLLRLSFVTIVTICFVLAPLTTLPVVVGYAAAVFWCAAFSPKPVEICACCCCAATTEDVKNGTLTQEQACCGCCNGTGVCSAQCASCCGPSKKKKNQGTQGGCCDGCCCCSGGNGNVKGCCDDGCSCCSGSKVEGGGCCDDCCCCCSANKGVKSTEGCCDGCCCCSAKNGVKSTDGCCDDCCCCNANKGAKSTDGCCDGCCCCSGTKMEGGDCCDGCCCCAMKKEGDKLTVDGCCDSCCCCSSGCCAGGTCCGGAGCGSCCCCMGTCCCSTSACCNKRRQKQPQMVVYEGVPVQIV